MSIKTLGVVSMAAATVMASTFLTVAPADARGGFRGGGFRGGGFRSAGFYNGGGYRGGYYGRRWGGAGIGLGIAGLAVGALAASSYYPSHGYDYPSYSGYAPVGYYGRGCTYQPRRVWGPYGWYVANVQVCY